MRYQLHHTVCLVTLLFPVPCFSQEKRLVNTFPQNPDLSVAKTQKKWSADNGAFLLALPKNDSAIQESLISFREQGANDFSLTFKWKSSSQPQRLVNQGLSVGHSMCNGESIWFKLNGASLVLHVDDRSERGLFGSTPFKDFYKQNYISPFLSGGYIPHADNANQWHTVKVCGSFPELEFWSNNHLAFSFNLDHQIENFDKEQSWRSNPLNRHKLAPRSVFSDEAAFYKFMLGEFRKGWKQRGIYFSLEGTNFTDAESVSIEVKDLILDNRRSAPKPPPDPSRNPSSPQSKVSIRDHELLKRFHSAIDSHLPKGIAHMKLLQAFGPVKEQKTPGIDHDGLLFLNSATYFLSPLAPLAATQERDFIKADGLPAIWVDRYFDNGSVVLYGLIFKDESSRKSFNYEAYLPILKTTPLGQEITFVNQAGNYAIFAIYDQSVPQGTVKYFENSIRAFKQAP